MEVLTFRWFSLTVNFFRFAREDISNLKSLYNYLRRFYLYLHVNKRLLDKCQKIHSRENHNKIISLVQYSFVLRPLCVRRGSRTNQIDCNILIIERKKYCLKAAKYNFTFIWKTVCTLFPRLPARRGLRVKCMGSVPGGNSRKQGANDSNVWVLEEVSVALEQTSTTYFFLIQLSTCKSSACHGNCPRKTLSLTVCQ
jgi:hypothetical protein